jgi:hypothetical protein
MQTAKTSPPFEIQIWDTDRFVPYARNPRKNDAAVDQMCASIREFGFKIPVLARSDGTVVDRHLRLKAARKLGSWPGGDTGRCLMGWTLLSWSGSCARTGPASREQRGHGYRYSLISRRIRALSRRQSAARFANAKATMPKR